MITLDKGMVAIVEDGDFDHFNQWKWHAHKTRDGKWYAVRSVGPAGQQKMLYMHREIMGVPNDRKIKVDHRDGDGLHNWRKNLRVCTNAENLRNRGATKRNTTGYKGVGWAKKEGKYRAQIRFNGKTIHIGLFRTAKEAARAYDAKATELFGDYAYINLK